MGLSVETLIGAGDITLSKEDGGLISCKWKSDTCEDTFGRDRPTEADEADTQLKRVGRSVEAVLSV